MTDEEIRFTGWEPLPLTPALARLYGYPGGTAGYRKLVADGSLVAIVGRDTNGYAFALSHVPYFDPTTVVPGRHPTFVEVYAARRVLVPADVLMVAVLEPMSYALRLRWERVQAATMLPSTPGLPTTVKCVQMYCEGLTEDAVFGTQDIPTPTPVYTPPPPPAPVGPVTIPDELLGDAELAALEDDDDHEPDPEA
jgi:hypothetical protein